MKTIQEKIERIDLTMARRPKGNYEADDIKSSTYYNHDTLCSVN